MTSSIMRTVAGLLVLSAALPAGAQGAESWLQPEMLSTADTHNDAVQRPRHQLTGRRGRGMDGVRQRPHAAFPPAGVDARDRRRVGVVAAAVGRR